MSSKSDVVAGLRPAVSIEGVIRQLVEELKSIDSESTTSTCSALLVECFSMMVFRVARGELEAPTVILEQLTDSVFPYLRKFERGGSSAQAEIAALLRLSLACLQAADLSLVNLREVDSLKLNATEREVLSVLFGEDRPLRVADVHKLLNKKVSSQWIGQVLSNLADRNLVHWIPTKGQGAKIVYLYQISPSGKYVADESRDNNSLLCISKKSETSSGEWSSVIGKCMLEADIDVSKFVNSAILSAIREMQPGPFMHRPRAHKTTQSQGSPAPLTWWLQDHPILEKPAMALHSPPKEDALPQLGRRVATVTKWVYSGSDSSKTFWKEAATHGRY
ncbi:MAG: hypothetical protein KIS61_16690 [Candidatus Eremiobacteraeota bacterium]|nr:hypothetical protein [Candidatus Eremiobacteraeota bacterium]